MPVKIGNILMYGDVNDFVVMGASGLFGIISPCRVRVDNGTWLSNVTIEDSFFEFSHSNISLSRNNQIIADYPRFVKLSDFLNIAFKYTELSFIFFCEDMANKWWYSLLFLCMVVVELSDVFQNVRLVF